MKNELSLKPNQKSIVTLDYNNGLKGKKATNTLNSAKWSLVSGNATIVPNPDGDTAEIIANDDGGDSVVRVESNVTTPDGARVIVQEIHVQTPAVHDHIVGLKIGKPVKK